MAISNAIGLGQNPTATNTGYRFIQTAITYKDSMSGCILELKIIPNAPRNEIVGWLGKALKVRVHAPALEGRANDELLAFLAQQLDVARRDVTILRGGKSRQKVVQIAGIDAEELKSRLPSL
jgi:uncharacterized protein (TIGR00251 family)